VLNNTSTSSGALATKVLGDGNVEGGLVSRNARSSGCVDVPGDQRSADDGVGSSVDDRDVGGTGVRSADLELDGNLLAGGVCLDEVLVVLVLEAFAKPDVTLSGLVVGLGLGNLEFALDVTIVITSLVVVNLLAASSLESGTRHTGLRRAEETVTANSGGHTGNGESSSSVLHFGC